MILGHKMSPEGLANLRANAAKARAARRSGPADYPWPPGETVHATFEDIAEWAEANGALFRSWLDLRQLNEVRGRVVPPLLPFERWWPRKGRFG